MAQKTILQIMIKVGQIWRTRSGALVIVTKDRGEGLTWRWALSNSQIADSAGRVAMVDGATDPHDLVELVD